MWVFLVSIQYTTDNKKFSPLLFPCHPYGFQPVVLTLPRFSRSSQPEDVSARALGGCQVPFGVSFAFKSCVDSVDFTTRRFSFGQPSFFLDVSGGQGEKDKKKNPKTSLLLAARGLHQHSWGKRGLCLLLAADITLRVTRPQVLRAPKCELCEPSMMAFECS